MTDEEKRVYHAILGGQKALAEILRDIAIMQGPSLAAARKCDELRSNLTSFINAYLLIK
jgi:hypothetical protein